MAKKSGIHIKKSKKGSLHTALGVKQGEKIPASKLKIKSTDSPALKKKKQFAINAKKFKHQAGGEVDENEYYDDPHGYDHFIKMSISQAQTGYDAAGQELQNYQEQNPMDFSGAPDAGFPQPIQPDAGFDQTGMRKTLSNQFAGQDAQNKGLMNPGQQQFDMTRVNTNPSTDLQQYLKTPKGQQAAKKYKRMGYEITGIDQNGQPTFTKATRVVNGPNKGVQLFNEAATVATSIGDALQEKHQRADEYRNVVRNIAPRFMNNEESEGLNNMPAYTMYGGMKKMGGPIAHGEPVGVVDASTGSGLDESMYEGFRHTGPYGKSMIYSGEIGKYAMGGYYAAGGLTSAKAKEILHDGTVHGRPITDRQRRYFGYIAGGGKQTGGQVHIPEPNYNFARGAVPNASDSASYRKAFYDYYYGNPKALEHVQGIPGQSSSSVAAQVPTSTEQAYLDAQQQTMKKKKQAGGFTPLMTEFNGYQLGVHQAGGFVPIPTEFQGYKLGVHQAGGIPPGPNPSPVNPQASSDSIPDEDYYKANATLQYFKTQLNNKLRAKDPKAYDQYQAGFSDIQQQFRGKPGVVAARQNYIQNNAYDAALTPEDVQGTLGDKYQAYINSLQTVNKYNVQKGQQPLYGTVEGDQDVTKLNYGRRFASVTTNPSIDQTIKRGSGQLERHRKTYTYDPNQNQVNSSEVELDANGNPIQTSPGTKQAGGVSFNGRQLRVHKAGGYALGSEYNLTKAQIKQLKANGYDFEEC
jgi:hypothetical protein